MSTHNTREGIEESGFAKWLKMYLIQFASDEEVLGKAYQDITTHHLQELQKAREEERERCIKVVDDYGKSMRELHNKMINAHEDSKMILAGFDMHSRLIAIKHITEKMNQSELDQPTV